MGEPGVSRTRRVVVAPDPDALARAAAGEVARRSEEAITARGRFMLALSGGNTPRRAYALLADPREGFRDRVDWTRTHVFFGDERQVHPDDAESNYGMASAALLREVPLPPGHVHRIRGEEADAEVAARGYEAELRSAFGLAPGELPRFDLVLLGLGADGHTASLFPGSAALEERSRLVVPPPVERLGVRRITLTLPVLDAARAVAFVVSGADKAERVADVLEGPGAELPAGRVRPARGDLVWLLDAPAARLLRGPVGTLPPAGTTALGGATHHP
jgi:6-phosphogluconolactonase